MNVSNLSNKEKSRSKILCELINHSFFEFLLEVFLTATGFNFSISFEASANVGLPLLFSCTISTTESTTNLLVIFSIFN
jgi:hypothetical protein